jgi:hypothetical protein
MSKELDSRVQMNQLELMVRIGAPKDEHASSQRLTGTLEITKTLLP